MVVRYIRCLEAICSTGASMAAALCLASRRRSYCWIGRLKQHKKLIYTQHNKLNMSRHNKLKMIQLNKLRTTQVDQQIRGRT